MPAMSAATPGPSARPNLPSVALVHVEGDLVLLAAVTLPGDERELRVGIDEAPDQPGARDAIDVYVLSRDPGTAPVVRALRARFLARRLVFLPAPKPALERLDRRLSGRTPRGGEEIDRDDLGDALSKASQVRFERLPALVVARESRR
jgi:hypothetical protein